MVSRKTITDAAAIVGLFLSGALVHAAPTVVTTIKTERAACAVAEAQVAARGLFQTSKFGSCDPIAPGSNPRGYYIVSLHGRRSDCGECGSTLMGWFAVRKSDGRVFEWDVSEWRLGIAVIRS